MPKASPGQVSVSCGKRRGAPARDRRPGGCAPLRFGELIERQLLGDRVANTAEIFLSPSPNLGRCKIEPDFGLHPILWHPVAFVEQKAEQELSRWLALLGSLMQPACGDDIIARNAETILIQIAEIGLGDRRTSVGFDQEKRCRTSIVMARKGTLAGSGRVRLCAGGKT